MEKKRFRGSHVVAVAVLLLIAVLSATVVRSYVGSVDSHMSTFRVLDEKRANAAGLLAASAGASTAITFLPGDAGTPIADKLMDLGGCFLFIFTVLFLEKYLLVILGTIVFGLLIPLCCVAAALRILWPFFPPIRTAWSWIARITLTGVIIFALIPIGVWMSKCIDTTYQATIDATIASSNEVAAAAEEEANDAEEGKATQGFWSRVGGAVSGAWNSVVGGITSGLDWAKNILNRFIEAIAVMMVTTCIIPLLPVIAGIALLKRLFNLDIKVRPLMREYFRGRDGRAANAAKMDGE